MKITIEIPDNVKNDFVDAFVKKYHYQEFMNDVQKTIPNPQSRKQFALEKIMDYLKETYHFYRVEKRKHLIDVDAKLKKDNIDSQVLSETDNFTVI